MSRYRPLIVAVLFAAIALTVIARLPHRESSSTPKVAEIPVADLTIEVKDGTVIPYASSVPKDHLVRLVVTNTGIRATDLKLVGYENHVSIASLAPGERWTGEFIADLPGDDFAWMIGGQPAGRFGVTGSHLVEGHR